jgi:hypothetical protein
MNNKKSYFRTQGNNYQLFTAKNKTILSLIIIQSPITNRFKKYRINKSLQLPLNTKVRIRKMNNKKSYFRTEGNNYQLFTIKNKTILSLIIIQSPITNRFKKK